MDDSEHVRVAPDQSVVNPVWKAPDRHPPDFEVNQRIEPRVGFEPRKGCRDLVQELLPEPWLLFFVPEGRRVDLSFDAGAKDELH
jgi:hypothetical protein